MKKTQRTFKFWHCIREKEKMKKKNAWVWEIVVASQGVKMKGCAKMFYMPKFLESSTSL